MRSHEIGLVNAAKQQSTNVLFDEFAALPLFKEGCVASLSTRNFNLKELEIEVFPNPTVNSLNIQFIGNDENIKITLYNNIGAVVKQIANQRYPAIQQILKVDVSSLSKGNYFIHYQSKGISKTKKLLKF